MCGGGGAGDLARLLRSGRRFRRRGAGGGRVRYRAPGVPAPQMPELPHPRRRAPSIRRGNTALDGGGAGSRWPWGARPSLLDLPRRQESPGELRSQRSSGGAALGAAAGGPQDGLDRTSAPRAVPDNQGQEGKRRPRSRCADHPRQRRQPGAVGLESGGPPGPGSHTARQIRGKLYPVGLGRRAVPLVADQLDPTYGSDKDGLVWGYVIVPGQPARQVDADAARDWLAASDTAPDGGFLWLHFTLSNVAAERWMRRNLSPPDAFLESLAGEVGSTRLELDGDALVGVIHDVLFEFSFDPAAMSTVSLCVTRRYLVSARLRPLRSLDQFRLAVKNGATFRSSAELLGHLLREQAAVLVDIVRKVTGRVDGIEDKLLAHRLTTSRRELGTLRGLLVRLQRMLAPEPAALFRLLSRPPDW